MDNKQFKKMFGKTAEKYGFTPLHTMWFKESDECIAVLELQKSNFGNYYQLNIKAFVHGIFRERYEKTKELKKNGSCIHAGHPDIYDKFLDLDVQMEDKERGEGVESLFHDSLQERTNKLLSKTGIKKLFEGKEWFFNSNAGIELERLLSIS
jgi:hypothetical protein